MDLGHVIGGAAVGDFAVGDDASGRVAADARLGLVRFALGIRADDESVARGAVAVLVGMGGVSRGEESGALDGPCVAAAAERGAGDCDSLLRSVDDSELHRVSPACAAAFEFSAGAVYRQQRQL